MIYERKLNEFVLHQERKRMRNKAIDFKLVKPKRKYCCREERIICSS